MVYVNAAIIVVLALQVWALLRLTQSRRRLDSATAELQAVIRSHVGEAITEMEKIPEWSRGLNVVGFLMTISQDRTLPLDLRVAANSLIPIKAVRENRPRIH